MTMNLYPLKMAGRIHHYEAWEERTISEVNVQYYLRSRTGNLMLAAFGNQNNKGQMIYAVTKEYLEAFGSNTYINAKTQWTERRDVVKWLISVVRNYDWPPTKLDPDLVPKHQGNGSSIDEEEKLIQEDLIKRFPRKLRSSVVRQKQGNGRLDGRNLVPPEEAAGGEPTAPNFTIDLSTSTNPTRIQAMAQKSHHPGSFQVGEKIEILCQDSGMRGCWFTCKIVKVSRNSLKVQYSDVDNVEGLGKLEEWVPASKLADLDNKVSFRQSGRTTIRPCPPKEPSRPYFKVGAAVEAWWNNGWWESFVFTVVSLRSNDTYHVFLPGEGKFLILHRKDLRVAKDWIDNTWVDVKPQPDILSFIGLCLE